MLCRNRIGAAWHFAGRRKPANEVKGMVKFHPVNGRAKRESLQAFLCKFFRELRESGSLFFATVYEYVVI